jgi:hypothetical protein
MIYTMGLSLTEAWLSRLRCKSLKSDWRRLQRQFGRRHKTEGLNRLLSLSYAPRIPQICLLLPEGLLYQPAAFTSPTVTTGFPKADTGLVWVGIFYQIYIGLRDYVASL